MFLLGILKKEAEGVVEQKCNESKSKLFRLEDFIDNDDEKIKLILNNENSA
jgi:hypothetical protein